MNQITSNAPHGQEHVKNGNWHNQTPSLAHRKQWRINPDVICSVYKCDNPDIEHSCIYASYVIVTLSEELFYPDYYWSYAE